MSKPPSIFRYSGPPSRLRIRPLLLIGSLYHAAITAENTCNLLILNHSMSLSSLWNHHSPYLPSRPAFSHPSVKPFTDRTPPVQTATDMLSLYEMLSSHSPFPSALFRQRLIRHDLVHLVIVDLCPLLSSWVSSRVSIRLGFRLGFLRFPLF